MQSACRRDGSWSHSRPDAFADFKRYDDSDAFLQILESEVVMLVNRSWLLAFARAKKRLPRRLELPGKAFLLVAGWKALPTAHGRR